ncbi:MAG TPA: hypothetical protein VLT62_11495 [Candidatus Methylomirabilis sp.]|nr:hypothetical protein [Candidatus Methylomirabilis sp.]
MALALPVFTVGPAMAAPGDVVTNGTTTGITAPGFLFEPEVPFTSLKAVPTWNELEQLLDNPYTVTTNCSDAQGAIPGNDQGFPTYCTNGGFVRRPGFGVTLPPLLVHPLNYNPTTGEEMRLLNSGYPGGPWFVPDEPVQIANTNLFLWTYRRVQVTPGADRVEPGEVPIDYNSPIPPDAPVFPNSLLLTTLSLDRPANCIVTTETIPPEGSTVCGGDPGEPNYGGFGVFRANGYSTPAIRAVPSATTPISNIGTGNHRLFDPERGFINARNATTGVGGLRKPSLRVPPIGIPSAPGYTANTDPNEVTASNENDYVRNGTVATALGKALFWDMQVGSDGIQACGTCHFNGTGTDTRTRNQINPDHLGGDLTFQLMQPNERDLLPSDFPLHKLANPDIAGDPACTTPLLASVNAGVLENNFPNGVTGLTVCDAANTVRDVNDVVSSMGVVFSPFTDIAPIGQFLAPAGPAGNQVAAVAPDLRTVGALDPIPGFQGFRRVEPRNTPTMQAAGFNFDNFWDGRARHDFNGGSVFGPADPQSHVFVGPATGPLTSTRQIIRFTSIASLATGPGLSEFEMSFAGRNWAKIGKKLLQAGVTPLASQLVDPTDSVLGPYSNQGGSACAGLAAADRSPGTPGVGKPGLCINYQGLIRQAYYPALWQNTSQHLDGCYTGGTNTPQCVGTPAIPILDPNGTVNLTNTADPFDGYALTPAAGAADPLNTNQFTQMEGNFSLFWGLSIQKWVNILVPDHTPFDQFLDVNPDAFATLGEPGEPGLVEGLLNCTSATQRFCFREFGNFKRDPGVQALRNPTGEGGAGGTLVPAGGTRQPGQPDPLLGLDIFFSSNLSLKNPNFRTGRCGECHAIPTLTDHTMPFTSKINLMDFVAEFATPGVELILEPLGRLRVISGFLLESEINENGQDAVERRIVDQSIVPNPVDGLAYPGATAAGLPGFGPWSGADSAFLDNGMYNLGVRPIGEDIGRGGNDAFGWPLSLTALMMKNLEGPAFEPGVPMQNFDPDAEGFGLFGDSPQDQNINPGLEAEPLNPRLPPYLAPFSNNLTVGDFQPELDEAGGAIGGMVNTLTDIAIIEGFMDTLGPFNPAGVTAEVFNSGEGEMMGTWPVVNRVGRMGSFKAPQLRNVELTGPYFHNGGMLTLRQVVDFYTRGGDFPISNAAHRDFNLVNMNIEVQSNLTEAEKVALVDFLLELTDERNRFDRAPFDHPEVILPVDGTAPDNTGRTALLADPRFRAVNAVGAAGRPPFDGTDALNTGPEPTFLSVTKVRVSGADANPGSAACSYAGGVVSHYCH